jgi:hypothetical protein
MGGSSVEVEVMRLDRLKLTENLEVSAESELIKEWK